MHRLRALLLPILPGVVMAASPADTAILAATRVGDQPNYSWTVMTSNNESRNTSVIQGRTQKGGFTLLTDMTPAQYLRTRYNGSIGSTLEMVKRSQSLVIKTNEGWVFPDELIESKAPASTKGNSSGSSRSVSRSNGGGSSSTPAGSSGTGSSSGGSSRGGGGRGGGGRSGPIGGGRGGNRAPTTLPGEDGPLSFQIRLPHEDLEVIVGSYESIRLGSDTFGGDLSGLGAALFVNAFGQPQAEVRKASGSFQCWVKNGLVVKYEVYITASVLLAGARNEIPVRWTVTTELRDFGTTKFTVPSEARVMFGS